jgi:hypothetical protein
MLMIEMKQQFFYKLIDLFVIYIISERINNTLIQV